MSTLTDLSAALQAVAPIDGVSADGNIPKAQWEVWYKPEATQAQKDAAQAVIDSFDWNANVAAGQARFDAINSDPDRADLRDKLSTMTPAQIDNWIDTNVTSLAAVRGVLKRIVKHMMQAQRTYQAPRPGG